MVRRWRLSRRAPDRRRGRRRGDAADRPGRRAGVPDHAADADHPGRSRSSSRTAGRTARSSNVESEHSAMSAAIGSALAGARTITATSSQGLALMAEVVYIAASMRAPIVMAVGNRALSGPINIHCDHSDSMLVRDSGVIQLFAENAQEAYDLMVMAPRLAEHPDVCCRCSSARTASRSRTRRSRVELLADDDVRGFVGDYRIPYPLLDIAHPTTQGPFAMPDYYFELRAPADGRDASAPAGASRAREEFERALRPRATARSRRTRIDERRPRDRLPRLDGRHGQGRRRRAARRGERVGLLEIRSFRPFPARRFARRCSTASRRRRCSTAPTRPAERRRSSPSVAAALAGTGARVRAPRLRPRRPRAPSRGRPRDLRRHSTLAGTSG